MPTRPTWPACGGSEVRRWPTREEGPKPEEEVRKLADGGGRERRIVREERRRRKEGKKCREGGALGSWDRREDWRRR